MAASRMEIGGKQVGIIDMEEIFRAVNAATITDEDHLADLIMEKVKEKNYIPHNQEPLYRKALYEEYLVSVGKLQERTRTGTEIRIRLYGASCYRCERIDVVVKETLSLAGERVDYEYVTDLREMGDAGIVTTPALTVDGAVVLMGNVPPENRLKEMLLQAVDKARVERHG